MVNEDSMTVSWRLVKVGIQEGGHVQIEGKDLTGRVVSLGHQLIEDGSPITIPADEKNKQDAGKKDGGKSGKKADKR